MRRKHKLKIDVIRQAIARLSSVHGKTHPLATQEFHTNGYRLFAEICGELEDLSAPEQTQLQSVLKQCVDRIDRDLAGVARKLYPITRIASLDRKFIVINPDVSFGRPIIEAAGVSTEVIHDRWVAGDLPALIKRDYGLTDDQFDEAIWYERQAA